MNVASIVPLADGWGMHGDFSGWWMLLMMPLMLLFWMAIVLGIVWIVRSGSDGWRAGRRRRRPRSSNGDSRRARFPPRSIRSGGRSSLTHRDSSRASRRPLGNYDCHAAVSAGRFCCAGSTPSSASCASSVGWHAAALAPEPPRCSSSPARA